ncbi:MAG: DUF3037 domain-containing protein [Candidatus Sulfotelmatobacter sp.]
MAEKRKLEFFLLRYVPDAVKGEFVNFGLVMFELGANGAGFADVRFTKDWRRVRCLDPQADTDVLAALEKDIRSQLMEVRDREALIKRIQDSFSNLVQVSGVKGCLSENPAEEIDLVARLYLKKRVAASESDQELELDEEIDQEVGRPRGVGRRHILGEMQYEFERAGVWKLLMHGVPISSYGNPRDPFKFDFGYRSGNKLKLFHAVSMNASVDSAVLLATRYQKIKPEMARVTKTVPILTAVVEEELDLSRNEVAFALEMIKESEIRVAGTEEMRGIAEIARKELGV